MLEEHVFFLGGYDLEMVTIKQILEERKERFFDKQLVWGARASAYKNEIEKLFSYQIPVLVELEIDIVLPQNYKIINHHNERSGHDKKTSLEQVAELLGVELTRRQKLISANDKAYIDGLIGMDATDSEINEILEADQKVQGVTEEDEKYTKLSIDHFRAELSDDIVLVYSLTEKTSAVTYRIYSYYRHIFIITPEQKFIYNGQGCIVRKLQEKYERDKPLTKFWFGGNLPAKGYFGATETLTKKEIMEISKNE